MKNFSEPLSTRKYAIALTRLDALSEEDVKEKATAFIEGIGLKPSYHTEYNFDTSLPFFEQTDADGTIVVDDSVPYLIAPISSVIHKNIEALKYGLYELVKKSR